MIVKTLRRLGQGGLGAAIAAGVATAVAAGQPAAPAVPDGPPGISVHAFMGSLQRPEPVPAVAVTLEDGRRVPLARLLRGHTTALQFIFTGCGDTCPIQGANFARVIAGQDARADRMRLLSVTITPQLDGPATMREWRRRWSSDPRWQGLVAPPADLARLQAFLRGRDESNGGHTTQVFLFDRQARLVYRSREWPRPDEIGALMKRWDVS